MDKPRLVEAIQFHLPHITIEQIKSLAYEEIIRQERELMVGMLHKQPKEDLNAVLLYEEPNSKTTFLTPSGPLVDKELKSKKKK